MWRIGVAENKSSAAPKDKKKDVTKRKLNLPTINTEKVIGKVMTPIEDREKQGSLLATEYLMSKRGSTRGSKGSTEIEYMSAQVRDLAMQNSKEYLGTPDASHRATSSSIAIETVKEIQDRVKRVVNEYETGPLDGIPIDDFHLLKEIQQNLGAINDDMLRINVGTLLDKYKKVSQKVKDDSQYWESRGAPDKHALLESVQTWMEEERLDDLDDDWDKYLNMPDTELIENCLDSIKENVKKISTLKHKISEMKMYGKDTTHLERQKVNLQRQVKQDVLDSEYTWKKAGSGNKKAEFSYLKNAATEIYNIIQRTRMEGMAQSHKFEEQLHELLEVMEEKEQHIEFLETRVEQQKRLVQRWCNDYDRLQSDHVTMRDEALKEKRNNLNLLQEIEMVQRKLEEKEDNRVIYMKRTEHDEEVKELEHHMHDLKQKIEVITWTVKEKDTEIEEHLRQIQRLKTVLRRGSNSLQNASSSEYINRSSGALYASKHQNINVQSDKSVHGIEVVNPPPSPSRSWAKEEDSMRKRVVSLENANMQLKLKEAQLESLLSKQQTKPSATSMGVQTEPVPVTKAVPLDTTTSTVGLVTIDAGVQTISDISALRTMTTNERRESYSVVEQMSKSYGAEWKEAAVVLTKLKPDDIHQIENALNAEQDMIKIWGGSSMDSSEVLPDLTTNVPEKIDESDEEEENETEERSNSRRLTESELTPVQVSNSVQELTEKMLAGDSPESIREKNTAGISDMLQEAEAMAGTISSFVDKIQGYIGCQTGMMNEAIERIKQNLPPELIAKIEKKRISLQDIGAELSSAEHSQEWEKLSVTEQIRHKMKFVEDAMKEMIQESLNVFVGEIAKQHAEYGEMLSTVKESSTIDVTKLISNPKLVASNIQNKVEASVRYMNRVSRAERKVAEYAQGKSQNSDGGVFLGNKFMDISGRQVGGAAMYFDRRSNTQAKVYPVQQPLKEMVGAAALEGLVAEHLAPKKNLENTLQIGNRSRPTPRDIQYSLRQQKRNRWKPQYGRPMNNLEANGMRAVGTRRIFEQTRAPPFFASAAYGQKGRLGHPVQGHRRLGLSNKNTRRSSEGKISLTMLDIHNQINQQVNLNHPKQPSVQQGIAGSMFHPTSDEPEKVNSMPEVKDGEFKLPKIL